MKILFGNIRFLLGPVDLMKHEAAFLNETLYRH